MKWAPVGFYSKNFTIEECKYTVPEWEIVAIGHALHKWSSYTQFNTFNIIISHAVTIRMLTSAKGSAWL